MDGDVLSKIALVTDSTSDLSKEDIERYNIHMLPLRVIYKDREYIDRVNITPDELYDNMHIEIPKTSLPSMEDMHNLFKNLVKEGYTHVIVICISSGLSGTYNSINLVSQNYPELKSCVFDSRALSMGTGAIVVECGKMIDEGKNFQEIVAKLPSIRNSIKIYFVVDTLSYLIRGGRIGKVSGTFGQMLDIKPVISINEDGVYYTYAKVRGRKQSILKVIDIVKEKVEKEKSKVWVVHGGALKEGRALYEKISNLPNVIETGFSDIGPVMGVHAGKGTLGVIVMACKGLT
jgi:DegV family protein with EDD domain